MEKKSVDERVSLECSVNTGVSIHWTGLLNWTTGLTFLPLKIILCPVTSLTCLYSA